MGACYYVCLRLQTKEPQKLADKLNHEADLDENPGFEVEPGYNRRAEYGREGAKQLHPETLKGFIATMLAAESKFTDYNFSADNGWLEFTSVFDGSYSWGDVIERNFNRMAEFCDKAEICIDMAEDGCSYSYINNYKVVREVPSWAKYIEGDKENEN